MTWTVSHIRNLIAIRPLFWHNLIQQIANRMDHIQVLLLVMATYIVRFTRFTLSDNGIECASMIFYIKPVTNLVTLAVNRQSFTVQCGISFSGKWYGP